VTLPDLQLFYVTTESCILAILNTVVPQLRRPVQGFATRTVHLGLAINKRALGKAFLWAVRLPPVSSHSLIPENGQRTSSMSQFLIQYLTPPQMNKKQCRQKSRVHEMWSNERKHVKTVIGVNGAARYTPQTCKTYSHDRIQMCTAWERAGATCELNNLEAKWGYAKLLPCVATEHCAASSGRLQTNGPQVALAFLRS